MRQTNVLRKCIELESNRDGRDRGREKRERKGMERVFMDRANSKQREDPFEMPIEGHAHKPHTQKITKTLCVFVGKEAESTRA